MATLPTIRTEIINKIDHATLTDLLSVWAGVFHKHGFIGLKETNSLRVALNEIQCFDHSDDLSLLIQMREKGSDFIEFLTACFGEVSLCQNLAKYTLSREFLKTNQLMGEIANSLLGKTALFFNRPLIQYIDSTSESITLFSTVIIDYLEIIERSKSSVNIAINELSHLAQPSETNHPELFQDLAESVGLKFGHSPSVFVSKDEFALHQFVLGLTAFSKATTEFVRILRKNNASVTGSSKISLLIDHLELQLDAILKLRFPVTRDVESWENQRMSVIVCIHALNECIKELNDKLVQLIDAQAGADPSKPQDVARSIVRQIELMLCRTGITASEARRAAEGLVTYCKKKEIAPSSLILAEIKSIHSGMNKDVFEYLQSIDQDFSLQNHRSHEKHRNMERVNRLTKVFSDPC